MSAFEPPTPQEATLEDDEYDVKARSDEEPARDAPRVRRFARLMGRRALDEAERERRANLTAGVPYLSLVRSPREHGPLRERAPRTIRVATYNVHRWTGLNGRRSPDGARAGFVISELAADVMALQEVLRPFEGDDPLPGIADALRLHLAFVTTRVHRRGELGNAILSRWPITSVFALDLSFSRLERRSAVAVQFLFGERPLTVVATHLALGDRTRHRQVRSILEHERLQGPVVLLGDLNAWRPSKATRDLEEHWGAQHQEIDWPASFPAARPILALDRIYARGARIESVEAHSSAAARKASDHLPIVAKLHLE